MATAEAGTTPGMSYFGHDDLAWEEQTPASRRKILRLDDDLYVAIVRWDPGFVLPALDEHGGEEIVHVLEGTFVDQYHESGPGTVIRGDAGSSHRPSTPDGVTFFVVRTLAPGERERIAPRYVRPELSTADAAPHGDTSTTVGPAAAAPPIAIV